MAYIGNIPAEAYISISSQTFTTINGTSYTLSSSVESSEDIALFLNNVRQKPSTYTATGTALTMGTATTTADELYCIYLGKALQTVNPGADSVGTSQIVDEAITEPKLAATGTPSSSTYLRGDMAWSTVTVGDLTTINTFFSNWNNIDSDITTTLDTTKNRFLCGEITVADTYTWTIAGSGTLTII